MLGFDEHELDFPAADADAQSRVCVRGEAGTDEEIDQHIAGGFLENAEISRTTDHCLLPSVPTPATEENIGKAGTE